MSTQDKKHGSTLTLMEAVETLSSIADLQFDQEAEVAQRHDVSENDKPLTIQTIHWLRSQESSGVTLPVIKEVFRVILHYLQDFYRNKYSRSVDASVINNVKTIMVLVGEAAQKLDKYTRLFYKNRAHSVKDLKEYKQLQNFYVEKIEKQLDAVNIGKWILALANKEAPEKEVKLQGVGSHQIKHVFIDLDSVKKDSEYELFFLKKEDGSRFFSPRLIRNIKLVNDFGKTIGEEKAETFNLAMEEWQNQIACMCAKKMIHTVRKDIEEFYHFAGQSKERELVDLVQKSVVALMMASNPHHLLCGTVDLKDCRDYFYDFQQFLRRCLRSAEYQKLMAYPPDKSQKLSLTMTHLVRHLCLAFYTELTGYQECLTGLSTMLSEATDKLSTDHKQALRAKTGQLWSKLAMEYEAMAKWFEGYAGGSLNKIIEVLENGDCHEFDPILQGNLPSQLYTLYVQDSKYPFIRCPSPINQAFIHKAAINEEFKAFLHACGRESAVKRLLFFNFQDRVTWKEYSRCHAIEELINYEAFAPYIEIVTLAKDTEFYQQLTPYHQENHADVFINNFKKQFEDPSGGFFFPQSVKKQLVENFLPEVIGTVHRIFFSGKNVLTLEDRLSFIEIVYVFLELKLIDCLKPDVIGLSCKDGLDVTCAAAGECFTFLKLLNQERLSENDLEQLDLILYAPSLLSRERLIMPDRFYRMLNVIKVIEQLRSQFGQEGFMKIIQESFGRFYKAPILQGKIAIMNR